MKKMLIKIAELWGAFLLSVFLIIMAFPLAFTRIAVKEVRDVVTALDESLEKIVEGMMNDSK